MAVAGDSAMISVCVEPFVFGLRVKLPVHPMGEHRSGDGQPEQHDQHVAVADAEPRPSCE